MWVYNDHSAIALGKVLWLKQFDGDGPSAVSENNLRSWRLNRHRLTVVERSAVDVGGFICAQQPVITLANDGAVVLSTDVHETRVKPAEDMRFFRQDGRLGQRARQVGAVEFKIIALNNNRAIGRQFEPAGRGRR